MKKLFKKLLSDIWNNRIPSFIWPGMLTMWAIFERIAAGLGIGKYLELATSSNNILPELLFISLGGSVGLKWVKNAYAGRATSDTDS